MLRIFPVALLALALGLAACGGEDDQSPSAGSTPEATQEAPASGGDAGGGGGATTIQMQDNFFEPKEATVVAGETVTWENAGQAPHNVVADSAGIESELIQPGQTFEYTAEEAGTIDYVCTIHPGMEATLTVE